MPLQNVFLRNIRLEKSTCPWQMLALASVLLLLPVLGARGVTFVDATAAAGIGFKHAAGTRSSLLPEDMGSGAAFADIDNDGDPDLYIVNIPGPLTEAESRDAHTGATNVLYLNNGNGTFTDVTDTAGVGDRGYGMGCVFADYDGDADLDLYITNYGANVLYRNNGDGTFTDVTDTAGVGCLLWSTGAAFADIDGDTDLDLYVCNYVTYDLVALEAMKAESLQSGKPVPSALNPHVFQPQANVLYLNNGDGTFRDATEATGTAASDGRSMQAVFSDLDNDGDMDLYVAKLTSANHVYRNGGEGRFSDVSEDSWAADFRGSMGLTAGDYDADGDIDLFMSHWVDEENALYRNLLVEDGDASRIRFVDESYTAQLAEESIKQIGWGTALFDYDNDGDLDVFVTNGSTFQELEDPERLIPQPDRLFRNEGDGLFTDVSGSAGITTLPPRVGRGATFADYDRDGDIDIFIVNNHAAPTLLRNDGGNRNNWLQVELVGSGANSDAIGAKIEVTTPRGTQRREVYAGESYLSANSLIATFGVARATQIESLQVTWQDGTVERRHNIPTNQRVRVVQNRRTE